MPTVLALAVCLHLINVSTVPSSVLVDAQRQVDATFASIGVHVRWTDEPGAILVIVLDDEPGTLQGTPQPVLGVSIFGAQGSPAAYVFHRRAADQANRYGIPRSAVLAAAMAHEVGHVLLPTSKHGERGLMRGCWNDDEFLRAARGILSFSPEEAASIRTRVGEFR